MWKEKIIEMKKIFDERGFMLLQTVFLTLIVSFAGMIILNGMKKSENQNATLRIIALHLAEEQFAELESRADKGEIFAGSFPFLGVQDDLKNYYDFGDEKKINSQREINFKVTTNISGLSENLFKAEVKVTWIFEKEYFVELKKIIRKKNDEQNNE